MFTVETVETQDQQEEPPKESAMRHKVLPCGGFTLRFLDGTFVRQSDHDPVLLVHHNRQHRISRVITEPVKEYLVRVSLGITEQPDEYDQETIDAATFIVEQFPEISQPISEQLDEIRKQIDSISKPLVRLPESI